MPAQQSTTNKSKPKKSARRRKRKSRTEISSSESSSSSSDSSSSSEDERPTKSKAPVNGMRDEEGDVSMADVAKIPKVQESSSESSSSESESDDERPDPDVDLGETIAKPLDPSISRLQNPDIEANLLSAKFEEYYMRLITTEFADELDAIRRAGDFSESSLPMLVRHIRQGAEVFELDEKRVVVEAEKRASGG